MEEEILIKAQDKENKNEILLYLLKNKGNYVSGEELSEKLKVTRTAIWKQINGFKKLGYEIDSVPRLGYCLKNSPDLFIPEEIWKDDNIKFLGSKIYYFDTIGSTNEKAKILALEGAPHGTLVLSEKQTKGKGRLGRKWESPDKQGIWLSIILRPSLTPEEAPKITLMTAVACAKAIREQGVNCAIKWPNDILYKEKKLAGILTEISAEMDKINHVVVGIGINVNTKSFPEELEDIATSLYLIKNEYIERVPLLLTFLKGFELYYSELEKGNFSEVLKEWKNLNCTLGRKVRIIGKNFEVEGEACDIDEFGALLIKKDDGTFERILSGDVSLR